MQLVLLVCVALHTQSYSHTNGTQRNKAINRSFECHRGLELDRYPGWLWYSQDVMPIDPALLKVLDQWMCHTTRDREIEIEHRASTIDDVCMMRWSGT